MDFFGNFFLVQKCVVASPEYVVAREGPVFEGRERKVRLAAFTVHIKRRSSANGRVPFLRVYRRRGNSPPGGFGRRVVGWDRAL